MEANCVCCVCVCVCLALQPSENEHSAACGVFPCKGNNSRSHVASASFCLKEEGSYFSQLLFVSSSSGSPQQEWYRAGQQWTMTLHLILEAFAAKFSTFDPDWSGLWLKRYYHSTPHCTLLRFWNSQSIQGRKMPKRYQSLFILNGRAYTKTWLLLI